MSVHSSNSTATVEAPRVPIRPKKRIVVVEDHPIFRHGLIQLLKTEPDFEICGEASTAAEALGVLREMAADLAIVDVSLNGANGIELTKQIRAEHPNLQVLVLSMHSETLYALRALRAGAAGYVMKREGIEVFLQALRRVFEGKLYVSPTFGEQLIHQVVNGSNGPTGTALDSLTDREIEILHLVGAGKGTREIATALHLSTKTVESHRLHIKEKLNLKSAAELVRFAVDWVAEQTA